MSAAVIHITNVKKVGPFLQIYGHQNPELLNKLNASINAYLPYLQQSGVPAQQLTVKTIYLVKTHQSYRYYRCILVESRKLRSNNNHILVDLIDYGIEVEVSPENVSWFLLLSHFVFTYTHLYYHYLILFCLS